MSPGAYPWSMDVLDARVFAWIGGACAMLYALAQTALVVYTGHRWVTLWRWWRGRGRPLAPADAPAEWPMVTVQLPLYNERAVVERLIDAVAALDYPRDRLEVQVLDDSTDVTRALADAAAERQRARGVDVRVLRRPRRDGFKAGALAAGLARARGTLIAVFDADFVPAPDFLRRTVPRFADPAVGMVQTRWDHLNRRRGPLTAAQAVMLDSHFLLEHPTRMAHGLFFNFNGTAGVWRRACIEDAGGWSDDTLTEDLDLSYRAQLRGWRFVFDPAVRSPAELPGDPAALRTQQARWAKGSIQTARKILPALMRSALTRRQKAEAFIHLTSNATYPLLLALALLWWPVCAWAAPGPPALVLALQGAIVLLGVVPVACFLALGQRLAGRRGPAVARDVAAAVALGVGMSIAQTAAVLAGLRGAAGEWTRTPKPGDAAGRAPARIYRTAGGVAAGWIELALAALLAAGAWEVARAGHRLAALPFALLLVAGFGWVGVISLRSTAAARAARR
jgi:hypothetical protein